MTGGVFLEKGYQGWLIKINSPKDGLSDYKIPLKYIKAESYSAYVNMQDVDDYTDANGYLHRDAVELKAMKIEFETPAMLTNKDFSNLMGEIEKRYTIKKARQFSFMAYIPEYDEYRTQTGYLADFQPQMYSVIGEVIRYNPVRLAFIGGVYTG